MDDLSGLPRIANDLRRAPEAQALIFVQRRFDWTDFTQAVREDYCVFECLTGTLAKVRGRRVRCISRQSDGVAPPPIQRRPEHLYEPVGPEMSRKAHGVKLCLRQAAASVLPLRSKEVQCEA